MSNNVVYGKLNRRIIPLKYTGVDTETANTTVDNENQTIRVDVIGIDGVVKYNETQDLTSEEKERAKSNIGVVEYTGGTTETAEVHIEDGTITVDVSNVYSAGENIQISKEGVISATDTTYSTATDSTLGLVKSSITGSTPNKDYNVEVNVDGTMKVNVPWTDTTYSSLPPVQGGTDLSLVTTGEKYTWNNAVVSYHGFNPSWVTNGTTEEFCASVVNDSSAIAGMTYLGKLRCSDLPAGLIQGEAVVEIISDDANGKAIDIILTSVDTSPYRWTYARAMVNSSYVNTGWIAYELDITPTNKLSSDLVDDTGHTNKFVTTSEKTAWSGKQDALVSGTNIKTINNTSVLGNGNIEVQSVIDSSHKLSADLVDDTNTTNKFVTAADKTAWDGKSVVSVSDSGTATDEVRYITINGTEKKLAGGTDVMYVDWS